MSQYLQTCIEPHLGSFAASFAAENYSAGTVKTYLSILRKVGHAMDVQGIGPSALTLDMAEHLGRKVPRKKTGTIWPYRLVRRFAQHLLDIGVTHPVPLSEAQQARAALLADFETYLVKHRGLSPRTIYHTLRFANRFLDHRFGDAMVDPGRLRPADVISFLKHVMASARRDKTVATHVRIFLQYLFGSGATATNLALSLPRTAKRWGARLPRHLVPEGVEAVLACVRHNPRHGARDYAMLLIMARLGLRAAEVIAIRLDDVDWRAGELLVRGKGKLHDRVPISSEVGDALSRYLREERGPTSCRMMFVTHRAPHRPFNDGQIVNAVLKDALKATGQKPVTPYVGSHLLRHSLAVQLVNSGASLDEVGDVLRHRSRTSTMIYARLDIDGLRSIAMPWPVVGGAQ
ncbi:integrase/recombinase XerD [Bradyrhizobium sp. S3.2.6]|uniref:tyrosine-type recombinase/integrase n=1 Tax=Bradyrhizobium sp. S3.2.6 TaxID=3156428 RepID=UPI0033969886